MYVQHQQAVHSKELFFDMQVSGMYSEESTSFRHRYPVRAVALDPRYGQRKTREFVTGGDSGELVLHSRVCSACFHACCVARVHLAVPGTRRHTAGSTARRQGKHCAVVRCRAGWASRTRCCTRGRAPSSACAGAPASSRGPTPSAPRSVPHSGGSLVLMSYSGRDDCGPQALLTVLSLTDNTRENQSEPSVGMCAGV
jgi:hypothetical protein